MRKAREPRTNAWVGPAAVVAVIALVLFFLRDLYLGGAGPTVCGHPRMDLRQFETSYTGHTVSLEADIAGKSKFAGKWEPTVLQKLSESFQSGREFRKALVAGFNACAISLDSYQAAVNQFQKLDGLARQIETFAGKATLDAAETKLLQDLVARYEKEVQNLGGSAQ